MCRKGGRGVGKGVGRMQFKRDHNESVGGHLMGAVGGRAGRAKGGRSQEPALTNELRPSRNDNRLRYVAL